MPNQNIRASRVLPTTPRALALSVLRRQDLSPHCCRATLGGDDLVEFGSLGYDQWFRLFLPTDATDEAASSLRRIPDKLRTLDYIKYFMISKTLRPVLRNYTVRQFRPDGSDGPELDVDFVLHGASAGNHATAGPAASWASRAHPGGQAAILDEGRSFNPPPATANRVCLVADESGLPALAGILASLPPDTQGEAIIELPTDQDRQQLEHPNAVALNWLTRSAKQTIPGQAALAAVRQSRPPPQPFYGFVVGEQAMVASVRRHWVATGQPKHHITFCGYWRH